MRIVTDSRQPGESKNPDDSHLFTLFRAFATHEESAEFRAALLAGMGWGEAKQALCDRLERELAEKRERYDALMSRPDDIEDILLAGAVKARKLAAPLMERVREAVGLRTLRGTAAAKGAGKKAAAKSARFVSFRDEDGRFRFRLMSAEGEELLLSVAYADPKEAGAVVKRLQGGGEVKVLANYSANPAANPAANPDSAAEAAQADGAEVVKRVGYAVELEGAIVAFSPAGLDADAADAAAQATRAALASLQAA